MKRIEELTHEEINEINKKQFEQYEKDYHNFVGYFQKSMCSFCNKRLDSFDEKNHCYHWFLYPKGIKKENFNVLFKKYRFFGIMAYLRWVANQGHPLKDINDLKIEKDNNKLVETTIKYGKIEWAFSCAKSDKEGHKNTRHNYPHYHFSMRVGGNRFINYNDNHIRMNEEDLFELDAFLGKNPKIKHTWFRGAGMQALFDLDKEELIENASSIKEETEEDSLSIHFSNIIEAKPGEKIKGEEIYEAIQESKKTGKSITYTLRKNLQNTSITTIISLGEGVPNMKHKKARGKKNKLEANDEMIKDLRKEMEKTNSKNPKIPLKS